MRPALELESVTPRISLWHNYDPSAKADLFSTALCTSDGVVIVDPIPLAAAALNQLDQLGRVSGVIITNVNHLRNAVEFANKYSVPLFARRETFQMETSPQFNAVADGENISGDLSVIAIEGAAQGEIALHHRSDGGTIVIGDALIHFEPYGFTFLPPKYCLNATEMKISLRKLLGCQADRIFFAHGLPIVSQATERLHALLDSGNNDL